MAEPTQPSPEARLALLRRLTEQHAPLLGFGMTSLVIGLIGLMLFFLPILGIPISALGLCFGVVGAIGALFTGGPALRWSLGGVVVCGLALSVNLALDQAPRGYGDTYPVPAPWQRPRDRPYVPPPSSRLGGQDALAGHRQSGQEGEPLRPSRSLLEEGNERLTQEAADARAHAPDDGSGQPVCARGVRRRHRDG
jgi:hypothetical protein